MCAAFGCNQYEVDNDLSVMEQAHLVSHIDTLLFDTIPVVEQLRGFFTEKEAIHSTVLSTISITTWLDSNQSQYHSQSIIPPNQTKATSIQYKFNILLTNTHKSSPQSTQAATIVTSWSLATVIKTRMPITGRREIQSIRSCCLSFIIQQGLEYKYKHYFV